MISGERVAERMAVLGLTQAELARRVGVSQPSIFKLIHNNKTGSTRIHLVARELRTTVAYLCNETDDPESDMPDETLSGEERELIDGFRELGREQRALIMAMVRQLLPQSRSPTVHERGEAYRGERAHP